MYLMASRFHLLPLHFMACADTPTLLRLERLRERPGSHKCHVLPRVCIHNRQVLTEAPVPAAVANMRVRGVHIGFMVQRVSNLGLIRQRNTSSDPPTPEHYSSCIPLVWWPLWCAADATPRSRAEPAQLAA